MAKLWDVQSDEMATDYEDHEILNQLFTTKFEYSLKVIKNVMACGYLTFNQLLKRYEEPLCKWIDQEAQDVLQVLRDGAYLQEVWSWLNDSDTYKQWVSIYIENKSRLEEIAEYYLTHPDFNYDLRNSALDAKNSLYLAQTQPGDPQNFNFDGYTSIEEKPEEEFITISVPGSEDYDRFYLEDEVEMFDDRGISSSTITDAEEKELKPDSYSDLKHSDIGKMIASIRQQAIDYRKENFIQRRDWKKLGFFSKPKYLDEATLQRKLSTLHRDELDKITIRLSNLSHEGTAPQDLLLLLIDGTYIDFVSYDVKLQSDGISVQTLQEFGQLFADEVIDNAEGLQDPPGWHKANEIYYSRMLSDYHAPVLYDDSRTETSRLFNEVVLEHIIDGKGVSEAYKQAYHACKMAISPEGDLAFRRAVNSGKSYGQAMHEFYNAAYKAGDLARPRDRVIAVHPDKIVILTASSQYTKEREINWNIARIKANNAELFVPADAPSEFKQRIFHAVQSLRWHPAIVCKLKE
jgi:hypothetical protein